MFDIDVGCVDDVCFLGLGGGHSLVVLEFTLDEV